VRWQASDVRGADDVLQLVSELELCYRRTDDRLCASMGVFTDSRARRALLRLGIPRPQLDETVAYTRMTLVDYVMEVWNKRRAHDAR